MSRIFEDITKTIGGTPLVRLNRMADSGATVLAKMESFNPCSSVKDRIAVSMIDAAVEKGVLTKNTTLFPYTSSSGGIASGIYLVQVNHGYKTYIRKIVKN